MTIDEIQQQIIEEFSLYEDWMDKYNYLIELSKDLPLIHENERTDQNLIKGCQSNVWLAAEYKDGVIQFRGDSDAIITKGIIALLIRVLSGQKPKDIIDADLYFIDQIGLRQNLSPSRSNGLLSMLKNMRLYAIAIHEKQKTE